MKRLILFSLTLITSLQAEEKLQRKLYEVVFKAPTSHERSFISSFIHVDAIEKDRMFALVNEDDYKLVQKNLSAYIISQKLSMITPVPSNQKRQDDSSLQFPKGDENYHTHPEILELLENLSKQYPGVVQIGSLGLSTEGRSIPLIRISLVSKEKENEKKAILFTGSHHAREHLSTEIPLLLAKYLASQHQQQDLKNILSEVVVYIAPLINPDGAVLDIRSGRYLAWRKNTLKIQNKITGVDLNRNYDYQWGVSGSSATPTSDIYKGSKPFSEVETQAVKKFVEETPQLTMFLSFHTFSELILYPYGFAKKDVENSEDKKIFEIMAKTMSQWNGYTPQRSADLYEASGDTCDWAYGVHGIYCFTFELTPKMAWGNAGFYPGPKAIEQTFQLNLKPMLYMIEKAQNPKSVLP